MLVISHPKYGHNGYLRSVFGHILVQTQIIDIFVEIYMRYLSFRMLCVFVITELRKEVIFWLFLLLPSNFVLPDFEQLWEEISCDNFLKSAHKLLFFHYFFFLGH